MFRRLGVRVAIVILGCHVLIAGGAEAARRRARAEAWREAGDATVVSKAKRDFYSGCRLSLALPPDVQEAVRDGIPVRLKTRRAFEPAVMIEDDDYRATGEYRAVVSTPCEKVSQATFRLKVGKPYKLRGGVACPPMTFERFQSCKDRRDGGKAKAVVTYGGGSAVGCRRGQPVFHRGREGVVWSVGSATRRAYFDESCYDLARKTPDEERAEAERTRARMAEGRKSCLDETKRQRCLGVLKGLQQSGVYAPRRLAPKDALQTYYLTIAEATKACGDRAELAQMRTGDCLGCEFFRCSNTNRLLMLPDWARNPRR